MQASGREDSGLRELQGQGIAILMGVDLVGEDWIMYKSLRERGKLLEAGLKKENERVLSTIVTAQDDIQAMSASPIIILSLNSLYAICELLSSFSLS